MPQQHGHIGMRQTIQILIRLCEVGTVREVRGEGLRQACPERVEGLSLNGYSYFNGPDQ